MPFTLTADIGYTGKIFPARSIRYKRSILYEEDEGDVFSRVRGAAIMIGFAHAAFRPH